MIIECPKCGESITVPSELPKHLKREHPETKGQTLYFKGYLTVK